MKLDKFYENIDELTIKTFNPLKIPHESAWLNADGTDLERIDDKGIFLDCSDDELRKRTFIRSVFRFIRDNNWHTDIIKSESDIDTESPDCKVFVLMMGNLFVDYMVFLKSDYDKYVKFVESNNTLMKELWKTDMEFFTDCVKTYISDMSFDSYYHFVSEFEKNPWGITMDVIEHDPKLKKIFQDVMFDNLLDTRNNNEDEDYD